MTLQQLVAWEQQPRAHGLGVAEREHAADLRRREQGPRRDLHRHRALGAAVCRTLRQEPAASARPPPLLPQAAAPRRAAEQAAARAADELA